MVDDKPGKDFVMKALVEQLLVHLLRSIRPRVARRARASRVGLVDRRIRVRLIDAFSVDQDFNTKNRLAASYPILFIFPVFQEVAYWAL